MSTKNMFPDSYDLLQTPEIWIGDTAATTDMTPHQMGMTEVRGSQSTGRHTRRYGQQTSQKINCSWMYF